MTVRRRLPGVSQVENDDRQAVVHAERDGRRVHHAQPLVDHLEVGNPVEARGGLVDHRIGGVDAVDLRALQDDVGLHLHRAQRCGGVGREVGVAGAGGEDHDAAFLEVADRPAADERLGNGPHFDRRDDARDHAVLLERILHGEAVDHGRQHAHVVARRAVHALRARGDSTEDIASADDDADLDAEAADFRDVGGDARGDGGIDAELLLAHQRLPGQFQQDALVHGGRRHVGREL